MGSRIEARASHHFKTKAEQVYGAWLDPEKVRVWMSAALKSFSLAGEIRRIEIDARVGGKFFSRTCVTKPKHVTGELMSS
jgi:uncharacterized protein YndB with AHSA1/START domain